MLANPGWNRAEGILWVAQLSVVPFLLYVAELSSPSGSSRGLAPDAFPCLSGALRVLCVFRGEVWVISESWGCRGSSHGSGELWLIVEHRECFLAICTSTIICVQGIFHSG